MAGTPVEIGGGHLRALAQVGQVHHRRLAHPLVHRHGGDVTVPGKEVHRRVHVGVGVAAHGEDGGLEVRALLVGRAALARHRPAEVRPDGKAQVDHAHAGHGVPAPRGLSNLRGRRVRPRRPRPRRALA